ncbi:hypothetical protein IW249_005339 [Micromonospora vinacea]|uniref:Transposase n=2 Tax=Micromonospora vinacea TaxID=709878 RepID=A0ABS0K8M8_9ACTN|nr:hypothetical protein [Micromonospora vinacea]
MDVAETICRPDGDKLAMLNETVRLLSQENDRIKRVLKDWQTTQHGSPRRTLQPCLTLCSAA